jgi:hypothetical protein
MSDEVEYTASFRVSGEGITNLCRQIYHYEDKLKAIEIMGAFEDLTIGDINRILNGDSYLKSTEDGSGVILVNEEDVEFKKELEKHREFIENQRKPKHIGMKFWDDGDRQWVDKNGNSVESYNEDEPIQDLVVLQEKAQCELVMELLEEGFSPEKAVIPLISYIDRRCKDDHSEEFIKNVQNLDNISDSLCKKCGLSDEDPNCWGKFVCPTFKKYVIDAFPVDNFYCADGIDMVKIATIPVPKKLIDVYTGNLLNRIQKTNKKPTDSYEIWVDPQDKEDLRRQLHEDILRAGGFDRYDMTPAAIIFRVVLENYIEKRVHLLGGF